MIFLWGASGHAKVIIEILEACSREVGALCDRNEAIHSLLGYRVAPQLPPSFDPSKDRLIISIGNNKIRKQIDRANSFLYTTAVHPSAVISTRARLGEGSVVMAGACVNSDTQIGRHVILNTNCSVDHDCRIEDFAHISPCAALAGDVWVGEGTHIGIGASVIQGIRIGKWCTIGAGSVIIRDVPDGVIVAGNPGRILNKD
jgi:sugar O-acyltransferase (sialic acid O-acetyltransferase NeuD family)